MNNNENAMKKVRTYSTNKNMLGGNSAALTTIIYMYVYLESFCTFMHIRIRMHLMKITLRGAGRIKKRYKWGLVIKFYERENLCEREKEIERLRERECVWGREICWLNCCALLLWLPDSSLRYVCVCVCLCVRRGWVCVCVVRAFGCNTYVCFRGFLCVCVYLCNSGQV